VAVEVLQDAHLLGEDGGVVLETAVAHELGVALGVSG
jgi:hypothetical protein